MIRRPVRTIRPGTQNRIRRSVLAWRRIGVSSGACPEAAAAGLISQTQAVMFNASSVQRRYPGLEMERLVPCPGPGAEKQCGHFFKLTNLENRLTQKEPKLLIECEECGAEHEVTKLLLGLSVVPSVKAVTLAELQRVIARDGDKTRQHLDKVATEMMSYIQLQFIRQWNTEQQIAEHSCPTVFSLYSLDEGTVLRDQKLRL